MLTPFLDGAGSAERDRGVGDGHSHGPRLPSPGNGLHAVGRPRHHLQPAGKCYRKSRINLIAILEGVLGAENLYFRRTGRRTT